MGFTRRSRSSEVGRVAVEVEEASNRRLLPQGSHDLSRGSCKRLDDRSDTAKQEGDAAPVHRCSIATHARSLPPIKRRRLEWGISTGAWTDYSKVIASPHP